MQEYKDEFRSNVTFQEVAEVAYRDALEEAIHVILNQQGVSHWTDDDTVALLRALISGESTHD